MSVSAEFVEFLKEQMAEFGPISARRMFGGAGLYLDGAMFAIVADDTLYLKADDENRSEFEAAGLKPFTYATKSGDTMLMSYWQAPAQCLDDAEQMAVWCRKAFAAAMRGRKSSPAKLTRR